VKKWGVRLFLIGIVAGLGYYGWQFLFPGAEQVIRNRLNKMAQAASFPHNEGPLAKLANSQHLAAFFSANTQVDIDVPGRQQHTMAGREEVMQVAMGARSAVDSLKVEFLDIKVLVGADKESAQASLTVYARTTSDPEPFVQPVRINLNKSDGEWLIASFKTIPVVH
jgi:hypothetical protein